MGMFGKMGDAYRLQKQAKKIKKELGNVHVFSESGGVKVTVTGEQELHSIEWVGEGEQPSFDVMSKHIILAGNKALKKSQEVAAERMKEVMGGLQALMGGQQ